MKGRAVAEEVVQETWLGVIKGLDRFEGRSSLKTWILSILVNQAKTRGTREARSVPFASLGPRTTRRRSTPSASAARASRTRAAGARSRPTGGAAAAVAQDREMMRVVMRAIAELPLTQQTVIRMRDVEGYTSEEVCAALDVSEANQRVLLHRARSRVRPRSRGTSMADGTSGSAARRSSSSSPTTSRARSPRRTPRSSKQHLNLRGLPSGTSTRCGPRSPPSAASRTKTSRPSCVTTVLAAFRDRRV